MPVPRAQTTITTAGLVLALSFAMLALVPVRPFRELAFAMSIGLILDSFVVRTLLVPALISLVGERSAWPSRLRPARKIKPFSRSAVLTLADADLTPPRVRHDPRHNRAQTSPPRRRLSREHVLGVVAVLSARVVLLAARSRRRRRRASWR